MKTTQTDVIPLDHPTTSKTLVISDTVEYNIVKYMERYWQEGDFGARVIV